MTTLGIAAENWERAKRLAEKYPSQKSKILGLKPLYPNDLPRHVITVDLKTEKRTVSREEPKSNLTGLVGLRRFALNALDLYREERARELRQQKQPRLITPEEVLARVSKATGLTSGDICGWGGAYRFQEFADARHLYCFLLANLRHDLSLKDIARTFTVPRHYSTIQNAIDRLPLRFKASEKVRQICAHKLVTPLLDKALANPRAKIPAPGHYNRDTFKETARRKRELRGRRMQRQSATRHLVANAGF